MNDTLSLMCLYAKRRRIELSTLGRLMVSNSTVAERLAQGRVTIGTVRRIEQWLSDNWPDDLDWPDDIPRPAPRPTDEAA